MKTGKPYFQGQTLVENPVPTHSINLITLLNLFSFQSIKSPPAFKISWRAFQKSWRPFTQKASGFYSKGFGLFIKRFRSFHQQKCLLSPASIAPAFRPGIWDCYDPRFQGL
jgi:hypothetical protein